MRLNIALLLILLICIFFLDNCDKEKAQIPSLNVLNTVDNSDFQGILSEIISGYSKNGPKINILQSSVNQDWDVIIADNLLVERLIAENSLKPKVSNKFQNLYKNHFIFTHCADSILAIPILINPILLYVNKGLLESAGINFSDEVNQFDLMYLVDLVYIPDSIYGIGCINNDLTLTFAFHKMYDKIKQEKWYDFKQMIENFELNYCRSGILETKLYIWNLFIQDKIGFVIGHNELLSKIKTRNKEYNYTVLPIITKPSVKVLSKNIYAMVNMKCQKDSLSFHFIDHLTSEQSFSKLYPKCIHLGFPSDSIFNERKIYDGIVKNTVQLLKISKPLKAPTIN